MDRDPAVERLLAPLSEPQQQMVDLVFEAKAKHEVWPSFHYVERRLRVSGLTELISTFPSIRGVHYTAVWAMSTAGAQHAEQQVGLTVAGYAHVDGGARFVEPFLRMLRCVAAELHERPLHPTDVESVSMNLGDLVTALRSDGQGVEVADLDTVIDLIPHEPSTWHGSATGRREDWSWQSVPWHITRFQEVRTVDEYLDEMAAWAAPTPAVKPLLFNVLPTPGVEAPAPVGARVAWLDLLHAGLRERITGSINDGRWNTAVLEAGVYLEHELRERAGLSKKLVGLDLVNEAMKPGHGPCTIPPGGPASQQHGWHALARGFIGAIRNEYAHGVPDNGEPFAIAAIFTASLILLAIDEHRPDPARDRPL